MSASSHLFVKLFIPIMLHHSLSSTNTRRQKLMKNNCEKKTKIAHNH